MKKYIYLLIVFLCVTLSSVGQSSKTRGALAYPSFLEVKQSNGEIIRLRKRGDRVIHWWETEKGEIVLKIDNRFVFAKADVNGNMVPSDKKVEKRPSFIKRLFGAKQAEGEKQIFFSKKQIEQKQSRYFSTPQFLKVNTLNNSSRVKKVAYPSSGMPKMLMILVEFSDLEFTKEQQSFIDMMNKPNFKHPDSGVAYGSFRDYYLDASFGQLDITTTVTTVVTLPHDYKYYGENYPDEDGDDRRMQQFVKDALAAAEAVGIDFSQFDNDNDGVVDLINLIHAGEGEEASDDKNTIWSHSHVLFDNSVNYDGVSFRNYVVNPEVINRGYLSLTGIGVICHEFGHALGLPDFYDTDYGASGGIAEDLGRWCLMSGGSWNNGGINPSMINAFSRQRLGWTNIQNLNVAGEKILKESVNYQNQAFKITTSKPDEYFIVENRQQISHDKHIPGHGMLMYHVDYDPIKWINNNINVRPGEEGMKIVHAVNVSSTEYPFPGAGNRTSITNTTNPNLKSNDGSDSPYSIYNIVESDKIISFDFVLIKKYNLTFVLTSDDVPMAGIGVKIRNISSGVQQTQTTNESGIVVFDEIPSGVYEYSVKDANFEEIVQTVSLEKDTEISVFLVPTSVNNTLSFLITDGEMPILGASVKLTFKSGEEFPIKISEANGMVEFSGLFYGEYTYSISKPGYITKIGEINFIQSTTVNIIIDRGMNEFHTLTIITKSNNQLVSGAMVSLYDNDQEIESMETDNLGVALFSNLVSANYKCKIEKDGYNIYEDIISISSDKTEDVDLDPLKTVILYAIEKDSNSTENEGIPISDMKITIEKDNDPYIIEKVTDIDGKVVLNGLYNGDYSFITEHGSFEDYEGMFSVVKNGEESFTFNPIRYTYTLTILTRSKGQIVRGTKVSLYENDREIAFMETNNLGVVAFTNLVSANYKYKIEKDGYNIYEDLIYISSDKTEEIDLDPLKTITLYAIARDSGSSIQEGIPISNMKIVIENENNFSEIEEITDKDGKVVLNDMYNGNYSFTTEHKSFKHYVGAFSVVKNGEENFNFNPVPFSVSELVEKTNQINIYPNPTVDIVYIEIFLSSNSILQVYDNSGHLIYENKYAGMLNSIDLGGYASGIYNVVIINGDDVFKKRVILK